MYAGWLHPWQQSQNCNNIDINVYYYVKKAQTCAIILILRERNTLYTMWIRVCVRLPLEALLNRLPCKQRYVFILNRTIQSVGPLKALYTFPPLALPVCTMSNTHSHAPSQFSLLYCTVCFSMSQLPSCHQFNWIDFHNNVVVNASGNGENWSVSYYKLEGHFFRTGRRIAPTF